MCTCVCACVFFFFFFKIWPPGTHYGPWDSCGLLILLLSYPLIPGIRACTNLHTAKPSLHRPVYAVLGLKPSAPCMPGKHALPSTILYNPLLTTVSRVSFLLARATPCRKTPLFWLNSENSCNYSHSVSRMKVSFSSRFLTALAHGTAVMASHERYLWIT